MDAWMINIFGMCVLKTSNKNRMVLEKLAGCKKKIREAQKEKAHITVLVQKSHNTYNSFGWLTSNLPLVDYLY